MSNNLQNLIRKVILGSTALSAAIYGNNQPPKIALLDQEADSENNSNIIVKEKDTPKLVFRSVAATDDFVMVSHRSHRSHSSHRSHYSHYSSYTGGSSKKESTSNPALKPNYEDDISKTSQLGARTLKSGMSGADVTELVNILLSKKYLKLESGGTTVTGIYTYGPIIEGAVKKFQSDNGLKNDGVCGTTTIYYLKNK
ncbi:peptidoglycan-binding protein [Candidatus Neomarinimicrobiota bacterium]